MKSKDPRASVHQGMIVTSPDGRGLICTETPATKAIVHDCEHCAAKGDTPLVLAFRLMAVTPDNQYHYRYGVHILADDKIYDDETWFDRGWAAGTNAEAVTQPVNKTPFELDTDDEQKVAWLCGYIAGSVATLNGWTSETCEFGDPKMHLTNHLPIYMHHVERAGRLPIGCLVKSAMALGIMRTFMDMQMPFKQAAESVLVLVANGTIKDLPTPEPRTKFDPNPTVRVVGGVGQYGSYIKSLDNSDPTWFWYDLDRMALAMKEAAIERRWAAIRKANFRLNDKAADDHRLRRAY